MEIFKCTACARFWRWMAIIGLFACMKSVPALENGVGRLPAMGYNPWNSMLNTPTLEVLKEIIDSMVSNGMRDAGYIYMCTDGGPFMRGPDADLQEFTDYGHSKGFKIGYYVGNCRGKEDSLAKKWAGMGCDYLKHDDYRTSWRNPTYTLMRNALKNCGRDIYYTIHPNTDSGMPPRPDTLCNAQRVANDINWKKDTLYWGPKSGYGDGVMGEVMASRRRENLARPGYFNDMDMMGIGMTKSISTIEAQTHFNFWCIMASILLEGSDIRRIPKDRLQILLNREVIAVNQDSLGEQGKVVRGWNSGKDSTEIISKRMKDGSRAVMLFNRNGSTRSITVRLSDIGLTGPVHVRDLWRHDTLPDAMDSVTIPGIVQHGSAMLRISKDPISAMYHNTPKVASKIHSALYAPWVRLLNTRVTARVKLSPVHTGLQVYNLQGAMLWETGKDRAAAGGEVQIPRAIKNAGMVMVRFVK